MDSSVDMPSFSLGLDTPSKLFSTGLTPASWSLGGTGLTPSILGAAGAYSASGWTPSLTSMAGARSELNPFELSLGGNTSSFSSSSAAKRKLGGIDFLDRDDSVTARNSPSSMFDLLATTPSGGSGRKRAMSSPAVEVGCGSSSFPFSAQQFQPSDPSLSHLGEASFAAGVGGPRSKRPRMTLMQSSALTTTEPMFSSFERESDESPPSSVVLTPPDSAPLYSRGLSSNDGQAAQNNPRDISVAPLSGPSKPPPAPHSQTSAVPVAQSTNLLSRLAQERSALIAAGGPGIAHSQAQPLPMPMKQPSVLAADIAVKAEPTDDLHAAAVSSSSAVSPTRPSPVTRGQSKRGGTRSSHASASTNAVYTSFSFGGSGKPARGGGKSGSPIAATTATKRKPLRGRKSTNTRKKDEKENNSVSRSASVAGHNDGDEDPEADDSNKRQQFLERNRVAACKSRQKKKEKVAGLEQHAADLSARNNMLQQTALALRQEAIALRQLVHAHTGCSCEHAQGYIARDAAGGGIATIDQLAGRVLTLDYSIPPAMGTEDDVYSFLDRGGEAGGGMMTMTASPTRPTQAASAAATVSAPGPAIPIVARPSAAAAAATSSTLSHGSASSSSVSPVRRTGMLTRRSSMAVHAAAADTQPRQSSPPAYEDHNRNDAAFRAAVAHNHFGLALGGNGGTSGSLQLRATSAPPTTPGWGDAAPTGDYFAPKRARVSIAA